MDERFAGPTAVSIRAATMEDGETVIAHRRAMFSEMGYRDHDELERMTAAFRPWLREKMASQEYLAWIAVGPGGAPVAGLGLWLMDWPPHMIGPGRGAATSSTYTPTRLFDGRVSPAGSWRSHSIIAGPMEFER